MCEGFVSTANISKQTIELALEYLAPDVQVSGSRMTEDGYDLFLSGPVEQLEIVVPFLEGDYAEADMDYRRVV